MTKKRIVKKEVVISHVNFFYETSYQANTVTKIKEIYDDVMIRIPCNNCKIESVETMMKVKDVIHPTFVIMRKQYCLGCWLQKVMTT